MVSLEQFMKRAYKNTPQISELSISNEEWNQIYTRFQKANRTHFIRHVFFYYLSTIRNSSESALYDAILRKQPKRQVKSLYEERRIQKDHKMTFWRPYQRLDPLNNQIILEQTSNDRIQEVGTLTGARLTELLPSTPERKRPTQEKKTPGGRIVREVCDLDGLKLFKHRTPTRYSLRNTPDELPSSLDDRVSVIKFTATHDALQNRFMQHRRIGQKAIMGISASNVFRAYGIDIAPDQNHKFHWSHLIAWFMGGDHDSRNLVPTTSASNYNTLEMIETHIKDLLINKTTVKVEIEVVPSYQNDCVIPEELTYTLIYAAKNNQGIETQHKQVYYIRPQSSERIHPSSLKTIDEIRDKGVVLKF